MTLILRYFLVFLTIASQETALKSEQGKTQKICMLHAFQSSPPTIRPRWFPRRFQHQQRVRLGFLWEESDISQKYFQESNLVLTTESKT